MHQQETADLREPTRQFGPLLFWCAVASLGVLFAKVTTLLDGGALATQDLALFGTDTADVATYLPLAILNRCAPVFTVVGVLGAATLTWQAGRRAMGATLAGAALMTQLVGLVVVVSTSGPAGLYLPTRTLTVISLVLVLLALAGALTAVIITGRQPDEPAVRPRWRVTIAAGLLAGAQLLEYAFQPDPTDAVQDIPDNLYLYLGLAFAAAGVVAGAMAGRHVLVGSAAAGLILGPFGVFAFLTLEELRDMPALIVVAALGSLLVGLLAGMSRWRAQIGMFGIAGVALGLGVLSLFFNSDQGYSYKGLTQVITSVLLVVGVIAAVAALAAVGAAHSATAETPAVLSAMPAGFVLSTGALAFHVLRHTPLNTTPSAGLLPMAAGALLVAAVLVGMVAASGRAGRAVRQQPIFYPVLNEDYATRIARDWNVQHDGAAYVTRFEVDTEFLARYPVRQAGGETILELWVPAEELDEFNTHIVGTIELVHEFR